MRTSKIIFCLLLSTSLFGSVPLSLTSIHKEMEQVMQGHLTEKKMTKELLHQAIKLYIMQFDPYGVYLLDEQVEPYFSLSEKEKEKLLSDYKENKYPLFEAVNEMIQKAIKKQRAFRRGLVVQQELFSDLAKKPLTKIATTSTGYCESDDLLTTRQAIYLAQYVAKTMNLNKTTAFKEAVRISELEIEEDENSYLFLDRMSKPLDKESREELFAFHILKALTASLDAHTRFLNPTEAEDLRMKLEKNYVGVGIRLEELGKSFVVASLIKGSSAQTTDVIEPGDELVAIDGKPTAQMTLKAAQTALDGAEGSTVQLELQRRSKDGRYKIPVKIALQRRAIVLQEGRVDTTYEKIPGGIVGVIRLHSFYQGSVTSEQDVIHALDILNSKGPVKGIVLDLRNNKGGFLLQAVKVAGLFIKSGIVVAAKYANGEIHYFRDLDPSVRYSGPILVLISKETASAAEIVAEALKEYGVAIIVGDKKSFGKGSIQLQTVTKGKEEESYFKVTVGRYYGVSGKSTQKEGVQSDIVIPGILSQKKFGEEYLNGAISEDSIEPLYQDVLKDIPEGDRRWYQKYYIPFIQPKVDTYRKYIPELAKKSAERIAKNKNYQRLLAGEASIIEKRGITETVVPLDSDGVKTTFAAYQLEEAINVLKDLTVAEKK